MILRLIFIAVAVFATGASAQTIRPMSTDRPDRTESPYTVVHGWLQIETDVASHGEFKSDSTTVTGTSLVLFNLKYGIARNVDLQLVFAPWVRTRIEATSGKNTGEDTGDIGLRVKINLMGNNSGGGAVAVLPFVSIPTHGDKVSWGFVTPVSLAVGENQTLGSMLGVSRLNDEDWWFTGSVVFGTALFGNFSGFLETYVSRAGFEKDAPEDVTVDAGLVYLASENWQIDAGVYYGASNLTEDWRVFVGLSGRVRIQRWDTPVDSAP